MAPKHFIDWVERQAQQLRRRVRLTPLDPLDPYLLAEEMHIRLVSPAEIMGLPAQVLDQLENVGRQEWSAGCMRGLDGQAFVVENPSHAETRRRASLMEEIAHLHLRHDGSRFIDLGGRVIVRSYNKAEEKQAYWVGAAALVPRALLQFALLHSLARLNLAQRCGVSQDLIVFRERVTHIRINGP